MAYVQPDIAAFRLRFPEFAPVSDTLVQAVLDEAIGEAGDSWLDPDRRTAQLYLTAHFLAEQGEPARSTLGGDVSPVLSSLITQVKRFTVGDVTTELNGSVSTGGGSGSGSGLSYESTVYGRRYLELMRRNFPAVLVV